VCDILHELTKVIGKYLEFYCAFGEPFAIAVSADKVPGSPTARQVDGGIDVSTRVGDVLA
jgi:hypothetical protein